MGPARRRREAAAVVVIVESRILKVEKRRKTSMGRAPEVEDAEEQQGGGGGEGGYNERRAAASFREREETTRDHSHDRVCLVEALRAFEPGLGMRISSCLREAGVRTSVALLPGGLGKGWSWTSDEFGGGSAGRDGKEVEEEVGVSAASPAGENR